MLFPAPSAPRFPPAHTATIERYPRYEDCTQDGRLIQIAIPPALAAIWETALDHHPGVRDAHAQGVLSLLSRLTVTSLDAPIHVERTITSNAGFELAHDRDATGAVSRLYLNIWAEVLGVPGLAHDGVPVSAHARVSAGLAFAEHTFTRPFAPPEARRVTSLAGIAGYPALPEARYPAPPPATAGDAPDGATWLDDQAPDPTDLCFTLDHTDGNQHVNSLVYVRYFLDAVGRRLAAGDHPPKLRSRAFDIAYRKPSFAGERVRAHLRLFKHGALLGAAGFIAGKGEVARPRCYVRVLFGA